MNKRSERIVVQVTPALKRTLIRRSRRYGMTVSDLMRLAANSFDPRQHSLAKLAEEAEAATNEAIQAIDNTLAYIDESNKRIDAMEDMGRKHRAEIAASKTFDDLSRLFVE
jgi:hypothetical protein